MAIAITILLKNYAYFFSSYCNYQQKKKKVRVNYFTFHFRLSWFTIYAAYVLFLALVCIILLPLANVFQKANIFLLFIVFILYGFSSIMFGFMLTPFFNKGKVSCDNLSLGCLCFFTVDMISSLAEHLCHIKLVFILYTVVA